MADSISVTGNKSASSAFSVPPGIFRAYDIRGLCATDLTPEVVTRLGHAIGSEALDQGIDTLLCGHDARLSSPQLSRALTAGICASGCNVADLGLVHTPMLYFATHISRFDSGVMLTASHNPSGYNGIKIVLRRSCLADNQIQQLRRRIEQKDYHHGAGAYSQLDVKSQYLERIRSDIKLERRLRLVIDCGNAVTGVIAPELFRALGCDVLPLFCELDGSFPNHEPDPTQPENLAALRMAVLANHADLGIAFDGDGDRLGLVTECGEMIDADLLLLLLIEDILPRHPGAKVIFDVKCSARIPEAVGRFGGQAIMHRSGHSFMKQQMQKSGAVLGGEFSAHLFIHDRWYGFDDGLYAAARVAEILSRRAESASAVFARFGRLHATPELKIAVAEETKFSLIRRIIELAEFPDGRINLLDGLRVDFPDGWGLVRASNTSPALLLRFEANSPESLHRIESRFRSLLLQVDESLPISFAV